MFNFSFICYFVLYLWFILWTFFYWVIYILCIYMGNLLQDIHPRCFPQNLFSLTPLNPLIYNPFGRGMVLFFYSILHGVPAWTYKVSVVYSPTSKNDQKKYFLRIEISTPRKTRLNTHLGKHQEILHGM